MNEKNVCKNCKREIDEEFNFCPFCGTAISSDAQNLDVAKEELTQLKFINQLIEVVRDEPTLKLLKKITEKLSK